MTDTLEMPMTPDMPKGAYAVDPMPETGPEVDLVRFHHLPEAPTHWTARQFWWLRERFQAITGIGLSTPDAPGRPVQRHHVAATDAAPGISYLAAGDPEGHRVLFVHGTPGEGADWRPFLRNVPAGQYRMAVDRPGFGASGPGAPVVSLRDQARALSNLISSGNRPATVVGSSYGGPVALSLAAHHPNHVAGVLLVGAAADPDREKIHPLQNLAEARGIKRLLPQALTHSNAELLALRRELEALRHHLPRISAPVTILQGLRDTLVPPENAHYLADRLLGAMRKRVVFVESAGHFLHILYSDLVEDTLSHLLGDSLRPTA